MARVWFIILAVPLMAVLAEAVPSASCLSCICGVESNGGKPGCGVIKGDARCGPGCIWDINSCSCGSYQIKQIYFTDCSRFTRLPITDWRQCSTDVTCATQCVTAYLNHYGPICTRKTYITCEEYGGIHNGGPSGCYAPGTRGYRQKIQRCCNQAYCEGRSLEEMLKYEQYRKINTADKHDGAKKYDQF